MCRSVCRTARCVALFFLNIKWGLISPTSCIGNLVVLLIMADECTHQDQILT